MQFNKEIGQIKLPTIYIKLNVSKISLSFMEVNKVI